MEQARKAQLLLRDRMIDGARRPIPECPFGSPLEGRNPLDVPESYRRKLACIKEERTRLNDPRIFDPKFYIAYSRVVEQAYDQLIGGLAEEAGLPTDAIVDLHENWVFSYTTPKQLHLAYDAKKKERIENGEIAAEGTGPTDKFYKDRPPEKCHLLEYYLRLDLARQSAENS